jgi:hypothetical protein
MGAMFNGRERGRAEWEVLLATADSHFVLKGVIEPPGSALAIIHVTWMLQDEQVTDNKGI